MKKLGICLIFIVIIALIVVGVIFFSKHSSENSSNSTDNTSQATEDGFTFIDNGKAIPLGAEYSSLNLGEPKDYYEVKSNAFNGLDKTYIFENYEVHTYPDGDSDKVLSVYLINSNATTKEGVKIGDSFDAMVEAYGSDYEQVDTEYTYSKGLTQLKFTAEDNLISGIEYIYNI